MTLPEIKKLLNAVDTHSNSGYRNRIVLEILYDTAIRRLEVCNIKVSDLDLDSGYIHIRAARAIKTELCRYPKEFVS